LTNKDKYKAFCETRDDIPIFSEPWWLDSVCVDGDWDVCIYDKNDTILGALPYYLSKIKGLSVIRMPKFTPYLGVQFFYSDNLPDNKKNKLAQKITLELIEQLPKVAYTQQIHHPNFSNWLPFYWASYKQTTMYTYRLNINNINIVHASFRKNLKRNLKNVSKTLSCQESNDVALFYKINKATYSRQRMNTPYSFDFLKKLDTALAQRNQRKIFITYNQEKEAVAAGYFIWDNNTAYYLAGGHTGNREAMSWTMWHAIQYFSSRVPVFDFEGSMIKNIAHFFSGFGATPVPYHHITKGKNKLIDILKILKP